MNSPKKPCKKFVSKPNYRRLTMNENPDKITVLGVCFEIVKIVVTIVLIFLMFAFSPFTALFGGSDDNNI